MKASIFLALVVGIVLDGLIVAQSQPQLNLMPMPASVQAGTGQLLITQSFSVAVSGVRDASLDEEVQRFQTQLSRQTGMTFYRQAGSAPTLQIHAEHRREVVQKLGEDESYELTVTDSGAKLTAPNPLGILRGLQTFLQLVQITPAGFAAPAVTIKDQPRFPWRGLMIDVSRHFIPLDVLKRNLDAMAAVKLNVFHWHLTDDQGFRVESKRFPKLQVFGSDGLYYTQEQVREVVTYARGRGIRVVPEFDIPGHATSWLAAYPQLGSAPGPYRIERNWGVFDPTLDHDHLPIPPEQRTRNGLKETDDTWPVVCR